MTNDFHDFAEFPRRWEWPGTSLGRWSLGMVAGFILLMGLLIAMASATTNEVTLTCTVTAAICSGLAGGVAAMAAIKKKGERSILMVLALIVGGMATMAAFAVLVDLVFRSSA